jgi:hypothetical protein
MYTRPLHLPLLPLLLAPVYCTLLLAFGAAAGAVFWAAFRLVKPS